ncbi:MAG: ATP-binding cassette domain-containing protein [Eubacterium sp.]|nr:ATP-binding cassette domain-containing protein [Eubacterium sp.]
MNMLLEHITKSFGEKKVLTDFSMRIDTDGCYCLTGPSGIGKTTVLRLILGLEKPDAGSISGRPERMSAVFQEDRLVEELSAFDNIRIVNPSMKAGEIRKLLARLLPGEDTDRPVAEYSGGMKRRVSILRAMAAPSELITLDEPFTGLDEKNRAAALSFILEMQEHRPLVFTSHDSNLFDFCRNIPIGGESE